MRCVCCTVCVITSSVILKILFNQPDKQNDPEAIRNSNKFQRNAKYEETKQTIRPSYHFYF